MKRVLEPGAWPGAGLPCYIGQKTLCADGGVHLLFGEMLLHAAWENRPALLPLPEWDAGVGRTVWAYRLWEGGLCPGPPQMQVVMVETAILGSEGQHMRHHLTYATQSATLAADSGSTSPF